MSQYDSTRSSIPGLVNGVEYGQYDRQCEINSRILSRNQSDKPLPPNFDPRPVLTKYSLFPILDNRPPSSVAIQPNYNYSLETNFTPPVQMRGPVSGFINHVNDESQLRNQYFALQRGADQGVYVPSSRSDLYNVTIPVPSAPEAQPYPLLFDEYQPNQYCHPNLTAHPKIGSDTFHNNTRTQLRGQ